MPPVSASGGTQLTHAGHLGTRRNPIPLAVPAFLRDCLDVRKTTAAPAFACCRCWSRMEIRVFAAWILFGSVFPVDMFVGHRHDGAPLRNRACVTGCRCSLSSTISSWRGMEHAGSPGSAHVRRIPTAVATRYMLLDRRWSGGERAELLRALSLNDMPLDHRSSWLPPPARRDRSERIAGAPPRQDPRDPLGIRNVSP